MREKDAQYEGRDDYFVDIDRMVNEGLGGGQVTEDNGLITDAIEFSAEEPPNETN